MGDIGSLRGPVSLRVYVSGTAPLDRVAVIRDNRIIYATQSAQPETTFTFSDPDTTLREAYYYVRVEQQDGQLGWSSPIWISRRQ